MSALRRIARYLRPYGWVVFFGFITVVLPVSMELLVPRLLQAIIDQGIRAGDMDAILRYSGIMLGSALLGALATLGQGVCRAQISQGVAYDLRNDLFRHIQSLAWRNLDQLQTGQLMTRISSDVDVVRMFGSAGLALLLRAVLMIVGSIILVMLIDPLLGSVGIVMLAVAGLLIGGIMRLARPMFTVVQERLAALNTVVQENLAGVRVVKAYAREPHEIQRFAGGNVDLREQNIKVGRLMAVVMPVLLVLTNVGTVVVLWWGGLDVMGNRMTVGELVAFNNYLMIGMAPLMLLGNILMMVSRAEASADRILEVLESEPAIRPAPKAHRPEQMAGRVVFDNVAFRYADDVSDGELAHPGDLPAPQPNGGNGAIPMGRGHQEVLSGVSFSVEPGQRIALLGATGAGKSTLVHLVPRFYDSTGGAVRIDDVDVRDWSPSRLRSHIGLVLQQTTLFSGTVRQNIAYGRPEATLEQVMAAAQAAQAHDFIMAMPEGYESVVEAGGSNLSGGQKQRMAIARALLTEPAILLLDDCTSAVDLETEYRIQEALDRLLAGRTSIMVAQRITSVLNADKILLLDQGRIVAEGSHRALLESSPIYREIVESQIGGDLRAGNGDWGTESEDGAERPLRDQGAEIPARSGSSRRSNRDGGV